MADMNGRQGGSGPGNGEPGVPGEPGGQGNAGFGLGHTANPGSGATGHGRPGSTGGANGDQGADPTWFFPKSEITTLALGTVLQQRYRVEAVVGIGGMGAVYRVRDLRFPGATKYLALKEMITRFKDHLDQRTKLAQFDREANILASLDHPAIPKVHDLFTEYDRAYLVLDYVEGRNLETYLQDTPGMLGERLVGSWGLELCDVLQYLHTYRVGPVVTPIVFRDLKPSNILLTNQSRIVVVDFGIAKIFQEGKPGTRIGTQGYAPPEQYSGIADTRSDIYSLGATLYHLLTRSDPQDGASPFALNLLVSEAMEKVIMRCLEYEREDRYQTALQVRDALRQALHLDPQPPYVLPPPSQPVPIASFPLVVQGSGGLADTGLVWKDRTEDEVRSSPAVAKDGGFIESYDTHLYALTRDGDLRRGAPTSEPERMRPSAPGGQRPAVRYCGSCGTPLDGAALAACWCPACGRRITSSGDAVTEGPDEPTVPLQVGLGSGRLAPESGPAIPHAQGAWSPTPAAMPTWQWRALPSRWVVGAFALAVVLALLSGLLVTLAARGNLQMVIGPYDFSHGRASTGSPKASPQSSSPSGAAGALATAATQQTPGTSATPSPALSATPSTAATAATTPTTTATSTVAAVLTVSPTSFQRIACVNDQVQITVSDSGGASLSWSANASVPGYTITPSHGTLAARGNTSVTVSNILQSGVVTFTAEGAQGSPQHVSISCTA